MCDAEVEERIHRNTNLSPIKRNCGCGCDGDLACICVSISLVKHTLTFNETGVNFENLTR